MSYFEEFNALISKWKEAYVSAVYSYVGVKTGEGLFLISGRILFEPTRPLTDQASFTFGTQHVVAGRFVKLTTPDEVSVAIDNAKTGKMAKLDGSVISLPPENSERFSDYFSPFAHPFTPNTPRIATLSIRGKTRHNLMSAIGHPELDVEMKAADTPFDSLDELFAHCGLPALTRLGDSTMLELVAQSPGEIDSRSAIKNGEAVIECRVSKALQTDKFRLGYRTFEKGQAVTRLSIMGDGLRDWREEGDLKIGTHRVPAVNAPVLHAYLSYDDEFLHQWPVSDPRKHLNLRHAIHQAFDPDLECLRGMLLRPSKDKHAFEAAVSTLLTVLGFSVGNYGRIPKLQDGPDIIAIAPSNHIAVVECTIGVIDQNGKLGKLAQRIIAIRAKLAEAGYSSLRVQSISVTQLSREDVKAELPIAGRYGIAVLCKEDLEEALNQLELSPDANQFLEGMKRFVPASDGLSLPFYEAGRL